MKISIKYFKFEKNYKIKKINEKVLVDHKNISLNYIWTPYECLMTFLSDGFPIHGIGLAKISYLSCAPFILISSTLLLPAKQNGTNQLICVQIYSHGMCKWRAWSSSHTLSSFPPRKGEDKNLREMETCSSNWN